MAGPTSSPAAARMPSARWAMSAARCAAQNRRTLAFAAWRRTVSKDNPRIAVLELRHRVQPVRAGQHRGGLRDRRRYPRQPDRQRGALGRLDHPARPARLLRRDGSHRTMDAGAAARLAGPARRPGRGELLQEFRGRDRGRPEGRTAARRRLRLRPMARLWPRARTIPTAICSRWSAAPSVRTSRSSRRSTCTPTSRAR